MNVGWLLFPAIAVACVLSIWESSTAWAQLVQHGATGPTPCGFLLTSKTSRHSGSAHLFFLQDSFYVRLTFGGLHFVRGDGASEKLRIPFFATRAVVKQVELEGDKVRVQFGGFVSGRLTLYGLAEEDCQTIVSAVGVA